MDTPMSIAILKAVREEVRGIRDDMREWREEWRRFRLARKDGVGVKRNEVEEFTSSEEEEKKPEKGKSGTSEDGWEEWLKNEKVADRKGEVETSYRRTEGSKEEGKGRGAFEMNWEREKWERELRRRNLRITGTAAEGERGRIELQTILGVAVGKRIEIQVVSRRIGRKGEPRTIVRLENAEIRDEVLGKRTEISRKARLGVDEDLTWTERATRYKLREKAEEEWQRGKEVRLGKREVWIDGAKWWWEEREQEWRRDAKAEGGNDE